MKMLYKSLLPALIAVLFTAPLMAEQNMNSVMFQGNKAGNDLTTLPDSQKDDRGARCEAMAKEIDELKGKPQRRSVLSEQYRAECEMSR